MGVGNAVIHSLKLTGSLAGVASLSGLILWIMVVSIVPMSLEEAAVLLLGLIGAFSILFLFALLYGYFWRRKTGAIEND